MKKWYTSLVIGLGCTIQVTAQTTHMPLGQEDYHIIDRLETFSGILSNDVFTTIKPYPRANAVYFIENHLDDFEAHSLSVVDQYNVKSFISSNGEWSSKGDGAIDSRYPWFKTFYVKQPDFYRVNQDNFFLSVNPIISATGLFEKHTDSSTTRFSSSRGAEIRGRIANKVGFYTSFTDNQENPVSTVQSWIKQHDAVPGADYYQEPNPKTVDYLQARGYIDFAAVKDHINVTFGYDKQYLGNGMRSLFLSDFSANQAFLRLNTRIWRLNYQNLYMELTPQYERGGDRRLPRKYATLHHLSFNATPWLNIGLFEGVVFNRTDRYEFKYLIPIIFYRQIERAMGSPDNAILGIDFKAIALKRFQIYGQFLLDELKTKELFGSNQWWGNKFGVQLGAKYFNAFGIPNLDLQGELNIVRPFTYSHNDTIANYTHYNQPLAHPLGAGFREVLGLIRYQPMPRLSIGVKGMFYQAGLDNGSNRGNDIFAPNDTRAGEYGYNLLSNEHRTVLLGNLHTAYEIKENLYIDLGATYRKAQATSVSAEQQMLYGYLGFRLNIARRDYDFY
jgi:hypothetical protein